MPVSAKKRATQTQKHKQQQRQSPYAPHALVVDGGCRQEIGGGIGKKGRVGVRVGVREWEWKGERGIERVCV